MLEGVIHEGSKNFVKMCHHLMNVDHIQVMKTVCTVDWKNVAGFSNYDMKGG